jgi:low temperature requirement protein LtrA
LRTIADPGEDRHTTWFELFFDLVFAAVVSQLGSELARHPSAASFGRFTALFAVVVWAWITYTLYANRFDTDDLIFRLAKSGAMLAIAASAFDLAGVMRGRGGTAAFAIGYTVLRWLLVALYVRARNHVTGEGRRLAEVYIVGYSATSTLWLVSILLPTVARCVLWAVAIAIDLAIGPVAWRTLGGHTVSVSHLTERFGTFFIIVLGGSWAAIANKVSGSPLRLDSWIVAVLCFVIALCLWWIYFDLADTSVVGRGALGLVYVYATSRCSRASPRSGWERSSRSRRRPIRHSTPGPAGRSPAGSAASRWRWRRCTSGPNGPRCAIARSSAGLRSGC